MSSRRDAYVEKLKAKLDGWNKKVDELEAAARRVESGTRAELQKQIDIVKTKREELSAAIENVRKASDSAWKDLRRGVKTSRKALDRSMRAAAAHFKKQPPEEA